MKIDFKENRPKLISGALTALIMLIIVVICLAFGYDPPNPPIPEEGVEVNLGDSDFGMGDSPMPSNEEASYAPPAAENQVATQQTEPSVNLNASRNQGKVTNPNATEQPKVENKEPEINRNALFTGRRNNNNGGGSQGVTEGSGNQGNPNGNPNSNSYVGNASSGNGSFSLAGRSAVSLPSPSYNSNKQGKIVVQIWVDQQGRVTRVEAPEKGSTITDAGMVEQAKKAARLARFNASANAPEEQKGTITYIFKI